MNTKLTTVALTAVALLLVSTPAYAQDAAAHGGSNLGAVGAALGMGIAALGCGMAQGRAAAAALEGIARNPQASDKIFTPFLLGLVFIETLVLFTFGMGFLALG